MKSLTKPTASGSVAPSCHCFCPPRVSWFFPHVCFVSVPFLWAQGFCHVCLYDQVTKEINRKSRSPPFVKVYLVYSRWWFGVVWVWGFRMFSFGDDFLPFYFYFASLSLFLFQDRRAKQLGYRGQGTRSHSPPPSLHPKSTLRCSA